MNDLYFLIRSFAAWTRVNCASKTFEHVLKISPNNNCMGVNAEFSKFAWQGGKTVTMPFGDVAISAIPSAPKCSPTGSLSVTKWRRRYTNLFLFSKLNLVSQTQRPLQQ